MLLELVVKNIFQKLNIITIFLSILVSYTQAFQIPEGNLNYFDHVKCCSAKSQCSSTLSPCCCDVAPTRKFTRDIPKNGRPFSLATIVFDVTQNLSPASNEMAGFDISVPPNNKPTPILRSSRSCSSNLLFSQVGQVFVISGQRENRQIDFISSKRLTTFDKLSPDSLAIFPTKQAIITTNILVLHNIRRC